MPGDPDDPFGVRSGDLDSAARRFERYLDETAAERQTLEELRAQSARRETIQLDELARRQQPERPATDAGSGAQPAAGPEPWP